MAQPIKLYPQLTRVSSHFKKYDIEVPKALLETRPKKPDLTDFPYPLPQKKKDYTCFCEGNNGVMWYGSAKGVTRYNPNAESIYDVVMYFSARRDLLDNNIKAIMQTTAKRSPWSDFISGGHYGRTDYDGIYDHSRWCYEYSLLYDRREGWSERFQG